MEEEKPKKGFKKGHKKYGGRKKGSQNKLTKAANDIIEFALADSKASLKEAWIELKPKEKWDVAIKILPFELAMKQRVDDASKALPEININFVAAGKETKQLDNTINIDHEEIDT